MSATNAFETALLNHIFQNANIANIGDATGLRGASTVGNLFIALFTSAPGEAGGGTEANYGGYARKSMARSSAAWTVSGNTASNNGVQAFPQCTSGTNTIVAFAIMTAPFSGDMLIYGTLTTNLSVSTGITPEFASGALQITLD